jgi:hypothetical protein
MEFRWVAGLALWTILSGPVLVGVQALIPTHKPKAQLRLPAGMLTTTASTVPTARIDLERPADRFVLNRR